MAIEQHNTAFEFETMLRRHLSRGGSMVEACAGFDADSASAYLENVLGQIARSRYESHLAGCPSCRRHIIELAQLINLSEAFPQTETQTTPAVRPETGWSKWKTAAAGWFDISAWNRGWATAGAVATVLLAVTAAQVWRQSQPSELAPETTLANIVPNASPAGSLVSDSQPQLPPSETLFAATDPARQQSPSPNPAAGFPPQPGAPTGTPILSNPALTNVPLSISTRNFEVTGPSAGMTAVSLPAPATSNGPRVAGFMPNLAGSQPAILFDAPPAPPAPGKAETVAVAETAKIIAPLTPSPSDNPMTRSRTPNPTPTPKTLGGFSFLPSGKNEAERKTELKEIEEGAPKLLTVRVRDKVFSFQGGMWVDHAYKPDMAWRVTKLTRDSEEYKQALAAEPQLKEFFERSAVIVVWKDKIYKVVPR